MNEEQMRAIFEKWLLSTEPDSNFTLCDDGAYDNWNVQRDWLTWCAAADSRQSEIDVLNKEIEDMDDQMQNWKFEAMGYL